MCLLSFFVRRHATTQSYTVRLKHCRVFQCLKHDLHSPEMRLHLNYEGDPLQSHKEYSAATSIKQGKIFFSPETYILNFKINFCSLLISGSGTLEGSMAFPWHGTSWFHLRSCPVLLWAVVKDHGVLSLDAFAHVLRWSVMHCWSTASFGRICSVSVCVTRLAHKFWVRSETRS